MNNQNTNPETLRKQNSKRKKITEQREACLVREKKRKCQKRSTKMEEIRLRTIRERRSQKRSMETTEEKEHHLNQENEHKCRQIRVKEQNRQNMNELNCHTD